MENNIVVDANAIQTLNEQVIRAVVELSDKAENMIQFVHQDILEDYKGFGMLAERYNQDADEVSDMMGSISTQISHLSHEMVIVTQSMRDISVSIEERAQGMKKISEAFVIE